MAREPLGVQVAAHGPSRAAARLWRFRGQLRVTVIAKATFSLVHQAMMKISAPDAIVTGDVHHKDNPARSVRLTSDLVPYLPAAEVVLTGHAHAPRGERAASVVVGLGLYDKYTVIFEKYLEVRGDAGPRGPEPFEKMPLVYERAFGGPGWNDNPFGVGTGGARGEPNIRYIGEAGRTAGLGPMPWPSRRLLSNEARKAVERPVAEIPEGFDWAYFHAAPADQRCDFLTGAEWLVLEGMGPGERRMRSRLPSVKGYAKVSWGGEVAAGGEPIELTCDTLRIDADRGTCSVTWRKSFAVADEARLSDLRIAAGVELAGLPVPWSEPPRAGPSAAPLPIAEELTATSTMTLGDDEFEIMVSEASAVDAPPVSSRRRPMPRPAPSAQGPFRLEVLSPAYASDPDDPLLSTLVVGGPSTAAPPAAPPQAPAPRFGPEGTLIMQAPVLEPDPPDRR
jgi:hypothetical protein